MNEEGTWARYNNLKSLISKLLDKVWVFQKLFMVHRMSWSVSMSRVSAAISLLVITIPFRANEHSMLWPRFRRSPSVFILVFPWRGISPQKVCCSTYSVSSLSRWGPWQGLLAYYEDRNFTLPGFAERGNVGKELVVSSGSLVNHQNWVGPKQD